MGAKLRILTGLFVDDTYLKSVDARFPNFKGFGA